jgi:hypothetical protein
VPAYIHPPMQYANDGDLGIAQEIVDHMGTDGVLEISVADIGGTANFQTGCQSFESLKDFGMIDFGLPKRLIQNYLT